MKLRTTFPSIFLLLLCTCTFSCQDDDSSALQFGTIINQSLTLDKDTFYLKGKDLKQPALIIEGNDIVVDFSGSVLIGALEIDQPEMFEGLGIEIRNGKNITIKNLIVRGYKIGVRATDVEGLRLLDADLSYNYRQRLKSKRDKEDESDWLSYHQNDQDEWQRYGMAVYLKNCDFAFVRNLKVTNGQNGLMLSGCDHGLFYNNDISFNSGVGVGMYRSSFNKVMHNQLDWNIRGYSFGIYNRGQDSAGILLYEQCQGNIVAYNSATHSGDGFFLWAGQSTIDSGKGGCNSNVVCYNDFSYASNNGIEVTFSGHNFFHKNKMRSCDYGLWGGYSYDMDISENFFKNNKHGIAIEHGNHNLIHFNDFLNNEIDLELFERKEQPSSWNFANIRNVESRSCSIAHNNFEKGIQPFKVSDTDSVLVFNNAFVNSKTNLQSNTQIVFKDNQWLNSGEGRSLESNKTKAASYANWSATFKASLPQPLPDGVNVKETFLRNNYIGRKYIIMQEYGPYNFEYPTLVLRNVEDGFYTFGIFGPVGNWKAAGGKGFKMMSKKQGGVPNTLVLEIIENSSELALEIDFVGGAFIDQFGKYHKKGTPVRLIWKN